MSKFGFLIGRSNAARNRVGKLADRCFGLRYIRFRKLVPRDSERGAKQSGGRVESRQFERECIVRSAMTVCGHETILAINMPLIDGSASRGVLAPGGAGNHSARLILLLRHTNGFPVRLLAARSIKHNPAVSQVGPK